jgi:hypothetical protein
VTAAHRPLRGHRPPGLPLVPAAVLTSCSLGAPPPDDRLRVLFVPGPVGTYLAVYGGLYDASPVGLPAALGRRGVRSSVPEARARLLQEAAAEALGAGALDGR